MGFRRTSTAGAAPSADPGKVRATRKAVSDFVDAADPQVKNWTPEQRRTHAALISDAQYADLGIEK